MKDTNVAGYMSSVNGGSRGDLNIILKPAGQRPPADVMVQHLSRKLNGIPGVQVFVQNPPSIRIGGRGSKTLYQYTIQGLDVQKLYAAAKKLADAMRALPLVTDVTSDLQNKNPIVTVKIDRNRAAMLGVTALPSCGPSPVRSASSRRPPSRRRRTSTGCSSRSARKIRRT